ncbi:MAG: hypothetical protein MUC48_02355 [Leptolyngbya sp. Prado105]|jgi:hypothetical protein|nr:hypothetical protein [Leptolyngbya sp. Prado105]
MSKLNDVELIRKFVQGEISFLANQNLRLEPVFNSAQLLAKKGELIATAKLAGQIRSVLVRQSSIYQELVNRILTDHQYLPTGINDRGLVEYEHSPIPPGYEANYTEVRHLWKAWRTHYSRKQNLSVLIRSNKAWLPVQKIEFGQENFFIQVPGDEKMLCVSDRLIWLSPIETEEPATQIFAYQPQM